MKVYSKTDIGLVRKENQDSYASNIISPDCVWAVVCDGMGGARGGKTASALTAEHITEIISRDYNPSMTGDDISDLLVRSVRESNDLVFDTASDNPSLYGMGTTCDLVFVCGSSIHVAHVGDSRTYLIRKDRIIQITNDHSFVQEMVDSGELTPEEAMRHPEKNIITRAVGVLPDVKVDYIEAQYSADDMILICSDGLSNFVTREEMVTLASECRADILTDVLVELAKSRGGSDNITVTIIY